MGNWQKAFQAARITDFLAAAAISLIVWLPLAAYVAHGHGSITETIAREGAARADFHAQLLAGAIERTAATTQLLPVALRAGSPQEMHILLNRLARIGGIGGSHEVTLASSTSEKIRFRSGEKEQVIATIPPLPAGASLVPMGPPEWTARPDELVLSQALFIAEGAGKPRFWGYASSTLPFTTLIEASRLSQPMADGLGVYLVHKGDSTTLGIPLLDARLKDAGRAEVRTIPLSRNGQLTLEIQPHLGAPGTSPAIGWIVNLLFLLPVFAINLRLLARPPVDDSKLARLIQAKEDERQSLAQEMAQRVRAEALLERSHRMLDAMFEHLPGMVLIKRAGDLRISRVNNCGEILLGRGRDLVVGRNSEELFGVELATRLTRNDYRAMTEQTVIDMPLERVLMPGQPERWIRFRKIALFDRLGNPEYVLEFGEDETERERLDLRLREHLNFLEQVLEAIPAPLFFKDLEGRYIRVNSAFERFVGKSRDELAGKTVFDFTPNQLAFVYHRADLDLLQAGSNQIYEASVRGADGDDRDVMFHKAVVNSTTGAAEGIVGIILDITERKKAEGRISQLNRILTVLSQTSQAIVRMSDRDQLLRMVTDLMHRHGGFPVAWVYLVDRFGNQIIHTALEEHRQLAGRMTDHLCGASNCRRTDTIYCQSFTCCNPSLTAELASLGLESFVNLPLGSGNQRLGGIGILGSGLDTLSTEEQRMLGDLADNVSFALEAVAEAEARRSVEERLDLSARVFDNSTEGIMITDARNNILMVNRAFTEVTGYTADDVIGHTPNLLSSGRQAPEFYAALWESLHRDDEWRGEIENRRKSGEIFPEWLNISVVRNSGGAITNYVAVFSDLTNRKEIEARLDFLAYYDQLTSLPNRTQLNERLQQALARPVRKPMALLVLDLDRFKLINDSLGHDTGDRILLAVTERLLAIVPDGACVCRLGGDEFAVLLDNVVTSNEAGSLARTIQRTLRQAISIENHKIHLSVSIGISLCPEDGVTLEELTGSADTAMYAAIDSGGNTHRFFRQDMNSHAAERMRVESRLHSALEHGELQVYYQPLVAAKSGRIVGAEALLRWFNDDLGGFVSPATFIPLLEETGLIVPIGEWVLRAACQENSHWREATGGDLFVAVNLSALQLADDQLLNKVSRILTDLRFPPHNLEIELTESTVMRDSVKGVASLQQLKKLGVSLSIDDFGTGYSSLSYLKQLPVDVLKIDRSFIIETPHQAESASIVRAIVALGHSLQLEIIAEGVEEVGQVEFLRESAVDILQGYHFSRPIPAQEFRRLLEDQGRFPMPPTDAPNLQLASATPLKRIRSGDLS